MKYAVLGTTGLRVSAVGVGTAAFGVAGYGIPGPGERTVETVEAVRSLQCAADNGVNLFDTAPVYGCSEELLAEALSGRPDCLVATKVQIPSDIDEISASELERRVNASLEQSLCTLRRDTLDIVQIHNATTRVLNESGMIACLERAQEAGKLRCIGASVYGEANALAALATGKIQVVQVALNLLDQRMRVRVMPEAKKAGVGILIRSALLKGALTFKAQWLPESLRALSQASERALTVLGATWETLPTIAVRFCLSLDGAQSVLMGVRSCSELQGCLAAVADGPMEPELMERAYALALDDDHLLNPSRWMTTHETLLKH
jgi:aryl-alcohol dehydrogenase-like predicted oxidoreductase